MKFSDQPLRSNIKSCCDFLVLLITFFVPVAFNAYNDPVTSYLNQSISLAVITLFATYFLITRPRLFSSINFTRIDLWLFIGFISLTALTYVTSNDSGTSTSHINSALGLLVLYFIIKNAAQYSDLVLPIQFAFVLIGSYIVVTAVGQIIKFPLTGSGRFLAPGSDFKNPNILASYIIIILPLIGLRVGVLASWFRIFTRILMFLLFLVLLSTQSRGAILSLLVCATVYYPLNKTKFGKPYFKYILTSALLCTLAFLCYLFISKSQSTVGRSLILKLSLHLCGKTPMLGSGHGSFHRLYCDLQSQYLNSIQASEAERLVADSVNFSFNEYVQLYIEFGILWVLFVVSGVVILLLTKFPSQYSILRWTLLTVCSSAAFSYTFHIFPINVALFALLGILSSSADSKGTFTLKWLKGWSLPAAKITLVLAMLISNVSNLITGLKWKEAEELAEFDLGASSRVYKSLYKDLSEDSVFLWYYGRLLHDHREYQHSIKVLNMALLKLRHVDIFLTQADNFSKLNDPKEKLFLQRAAALAPGRLFPKYYLMQYFLRQNDGENALVAAKDIERLPMKVITPDATAIKNEAATTIAMLLPKQKSHELNQTK